jgi:hypothetical protein
LFLVSICWKPKKPKKISKSVLTFFFNFLVNCQNCWQLHDLFAVYLKKAKKKNLFINTNLKKNFFLTFCLPLTTFFRKLVCILYQIDISLKTTMYFISHFLKILFSRIVSTSTSTCAALLSTGMEKVIGEEFRSNLT